MDRVPDVGAGWRDSITPHLHELGTIVYNPCSKPIDNPEVLEDSGTIEEINQLKQDGEFDLIRSKYKSIRNVDLRMVDTSDYLVANIDTEVHACGTYEEITTANRQKKPILVHCEQGKVGVPNWLLYMIPHEHIFSTWQEVLVYLERINQGWNDNTGRWVFFNIEEELKAIELHKEGITC